MRKLALLRMIVVSIALSVGIIGHALSAEPEDMLVFSPTGDALFDRYAENCLIGSIIPLIEREEVDSIGTYLYWEYQKVNHWFDDNNWALFPAQIDDEILAEWEPEFGNDPRYWQLRFWCATNEWFGNEEMEDEIEAKHPERFLWEAVDRGVADAETLMILNRVLGYHHGKTSWNVEGTTWAESPEGVIIDEPLTFYEEKELRGELVNNIVAEGSDEAWAYWTRADYYFDHGESELGFADIAAGNNASVNRLAVCFPLSFVLDRIDAEKHPGNEVLAGAIIEAGMLDGWSYPNVAELTKWRDRLKEHQLMMSLGMPSIQLDNLYRSIGLRSLSTRGCRAWYRKFSDINFLIRQGRGLFEESYQGEEIISLDFLSNFVNWFKVQELQRNKDNLDKSPGFFAAEYELYFDKMDQSWFPFPNGYPLNYEYVFMTDLPQTRERYMEQGLYTKGIYRYEKLYNFWVEENEFAENEYRLVIEKLLEFDFNTMLWPDSWPIGNWVQN